MIPTTRLRRAAFVFSLMIAATGIGTAALAEGGNSLASREAESARATAASKGTQRMALRAPAVVQQQPRASARTVQPVVAEAPAMRWGKRGSDAWTRELLAALDSHGNRLVSTVPGDVSTYCPGYVTASSEQRRAFWAGLVSSIAKHESTWNPRAKGGGGKWLGLMQIAPSTWRSYGCDGQILEGGDNLSCAVRIMAKQVGRDGVIAGGGARGVGRDWAPMRSGSKRADIAGWTRQQSYCNVRSAGL